jgi:hypothetical protein
VEARARASEEADQGPVSLERAAPEASTWRASAAPARRVLVATRRVLVATWRVLVATRRVLVAEVREAQGAELLEARERLEERRDRGVLLAPRPGAPFRPTPLLPMPLLPMRARGT